MASERDTEEITKNLLNNSGYNEENGFIIEYQISEKKEIADLLSKSSKNGKRNNGRPEFIVRRKDLNYDNGILIVIECKRDINKHSSKDDNKPFSAKTYAVDGAIHYGEFLRKKYNVLAIGISGTDPNKLKITNYYMPKNSAEIIKFSNDSIIRYKELSEKINRLGMDKLKILLVKTNYAEYIKEKVNKFGLNYSRFDKKDVLAYLINNEKAIKQTKSITELTDNCDYDITLMIYSENGEYGSTWLTLYESEYLEKVYIKYSYRYKGNIAEDIYELKRKIEPTILFEEDRLEIEKQRLTQNIENLTKALTEIESEYDIKYENVFSDKKTNLIYYSISTDYDIDDYSEQGIEKIKASFIYDYKEELKKYKQQIFKDANNINIIISVLDMFKKEIVKIYSNNNDDNHEIQMNVKLSKDLDCSFTKPSKLVINKQEYNINSWKDFLLISVKYIRKINKVKFDNDLLTNKFTFNRDRISMYPETLRSPSHNISYSDDVPIYVETNLSANAIKDFVIKLCEMYNMDTEIFEITVSK